MNNQKAIFCGDIVEENGKTVKENNMEKQHNILIGSLVEVLGPDEAKGLRLFVMRHSRDCDGTPLYALTGDSDYIGFEEEKEKDLSAADRITVYMEGRLKGLGMGKCMGEWGEESLRLIRLPDGTIPDININVCGNEITLQTLKEDVEAARAKGFNHDFAFTRHTVQGLIEKIDEFSGALT